MAGTFRQARRERRQLRAAARKGRRDGRRGIPSLEDTRAPANLEGIKVQGEAQLWQLAQRWQLEDEPLKSTVFVARDALDEVLVEADALRADVIQTRA